jgi:hypothetical protein
MKDFKNAFGEADQEFKNSLSLTLDKIEKNEERYPVKKNKGKLIIVIAIVCIFLSTTALALTNIWGIQDYLSDIFGLRILPEASDIIQSDIPQKIGKTDYATFFVREAIYDGQYVYLLVAAKPTRSNYLLLGADESLPDQDENKKVYVRTEVWPVHEGGCVLDFALEDDGTLIYMIQFEYENAASEVEINLECLTEPIVNDMVGDNRSQQVTLSATLKNTGTKETAVSTEPVEYSDFGIRVDKVTLTNSPMAIYAKIEYTIIDNAELTFNDRILMFVDENGMVLSAFHSERKIALDDSNTRFKDRFTLFASDTLPQEINLRIYDSWDKIEIHATHTFKMK